MHFSAHKSPRIRTTAGMQSALLPPSSYPTEKKEAVGRWWRPIKITLIKEAYKQQSRAGGVRIAIDGIDIIRCIIVNNKHG